MHIDILDFATLEPRPTSLQISIISFSIWCSRKAVTKKA